MYLFKKLIEFINSVKSAKINFELALNITYALNDPFIGNCKSIAHIVAIFTAPTRHAEQIAVDAVQLKAGKGIVGDRFFGLRRKHPGQNLTLIEFEELESFNRTFSLQIPLNATRRNLITQGVRLNDLVGVTFKIGQVVCRGIELCEPCKVMARQFAASSLSQAEIIRAFTHKSGIRVEVLVDGVVRLGDEIV